MVGQNLVTNVSMKRDGDSLGKNHVKNCLITGGDLLIIDSPEKLDISLSTIILKRYRIPTINELHFSELRNDSRLTWIGGRRDVDGIWKWVDGSLIVNQTIESSNVSTDERNCLAIGNNQSWIAWDCNSYEDTICIRSNDGD